MFFCLTRVDFRHQCRPPRALMCPPAFPLETRTFFSLSTARCESLVFTFWFLVRALLLLVSASCAYSSRFNSAVHDCVCLVSCIVLLCDDRALVSPLCFMQCMTLRKPSSSLRPFSPDVSVSSVSFVSSLEFWGALFELRWIGPDGPMGGGVRSLYL